MKKHFYTHLVDLEALLLELDTMDLEHEEKKDLQEMIDQSLHQAILEAVLDELSHEDKLIFLSHISHNNHDKVWEHLKKKVDKIEGKIKEAAESTMVELYKDIKAVKNEEEGE